MTDEINISKLNPNVIEFVPSSVRRLQPQKKQETLKKSKFKSPKKLDQSTSKVNTEIKVSSENKICDTEKKDEAKTKTPMNLLIAESNSSTINESGKHKQKSMNLESSASESMNSVSKATGSSNVISLEKKVDISNMKSEEIEEVKMKIKSKIIDSSGDSIKQKKERNVAIAALLRLNATAPAVPAEKPVKLITPDYFKTLPTEEKTDTEKESDVKDTNETVEELEEPATSTSSKPVVYKDPFVEESIAKVNSWFDNEDSPKVPKPKPLPVQPPAAAPVPLPPVQFKDVLSFKKKNASSLSINSRKSETNSEKKKQFTAFVPSSYANDLLQKYEKNAKTQVAPRVDWGEALERRLMEKDKEIKKKMRDAQDGASPNSVGGNGNSA
ncbi:hypothetical protein MSG28_004371 [Choristoneura fumiferana]|uniref:Uncharacterized protein n=2 Tax=Choristoneura fumiferana TaxID=7141 RepID=A0ACC0KJP4_CHOFU|nr:hypothetical protein MSG28_004371 [Choristoneura fumiferana]